MVVFVLSVFCCVFFLGGGFPDFVFLGRGGFPFSCVCSLFCGGGVPLFFWGGVPYLFLSFWGGVQPLSDGVLFFWEFPI